MKTQPGDKEWTRGKSGQDSNTFYIKNNPSYWSITYSERKNILPYIQTTIIRTEKIRTKPTFH